MRLNPFELRDAGAIPVSIWTLSVLNKLVLGNFPLEFGLRDEDVILFRLFVPWSLRSGCVRPLTVKDVAVRSKDKVDEGSLAHA